MSLQSVQYVTSTTTVDFDNTAFICDGTNAGFTFTLPDCSSNDGLNFFVKRTDSSDHILTIEGYTSSQLIDGLVSRHMTNGDTWLYYVSYGGNWYRY